MSLALVAGGAVVATSVGLPLQEAHADGLPRWSSPATWGGAVPARGAAVVLRRAVLLDVDVHVRSLTIEEGGALQFDPGTSRTLTSDGNVVVRGTLQMRPASVDSRHVLRFPSVDENRYVGGGMQVLDSDVGLWCMDRGVLDLAGTPKLAWARAAGSVERGARTVVLQADPVGWAVGDQLAITPTQPVGPGHHDAYDYASVAGISGRTVTLTTATNHAHPAVRVGDGMTLGAEVLNLTRNVMVEGSAAGRAHVFVMTSRPQVMSWFAARWMGPRQADGQHTASVLGRYGLHFHMGGDATRGSQVVGAVVRDTGAHAFVVHGSHGVSLTSCISHDTFDDAYWWDGKVDTRTPGVPTHDASFVACVASRVRVDPPFRGFRLSGYVLGAGTGNRAVDCVAVGVQGTKDSSGFIWPENKDTGVWDFQRGVSHNNACHGIFTWQNSAFEHVVRDFVCFHNGDSGISHGAYTNRYHYTNGYLYGNGVAAVTLHATSKADSTHLRFSGLHCDGAGVARHGVSLAKHNVDAVTGARTQFSSCAFTGQTAQAVAATHDTTSGPTAPELLDLVDCSSTTPLLWLRDDTRAESEVRVQTDGSTLMARVRSQPGTLRSEWNASTTRIAPFASEGRAPARAFSVVPAASMPSLGPLPPPPAGPSTRHGGVEMTLRTSRFGPGRGRGNLHTLRVVNHEDHDCTVAVQRDGGAAGERSVPAGQALTWRFHSPSRTRAVSASCHEHTSTWEAPFGRRPTAGSHR